MTLSGMLGAIERFCRDRRRSARETMEGLEEVRDLVEKRIKELREVIEDEEG